jgi:hypothetical protein
MSQLAGYHWKGHVIKMKTVDCTFGDVHAGDGANIGKGSPTQVNVTWSRLSLFVDTIISSGFRDSLHCARDRTSRLRSGFQAISCLAKVPCLRLNY